MRPLCDDESDSPQAITRDYTLDIHDENGRAPLLSVFGGKLTTYRKLAEHALEKLTPYYKGIGPAWTKTAVLPGGDIGGDRDDYAAKLRRRFPFISESMARHYARTYGSNSELILDKATSLDDLGEHFGHEFLKPNCAIWLNMNGFVHWMTLSGGGPSRACGSRRNSRRALANGWRSTRESLSCRWRHNSVNSNGARRPRFYGNPVTALPDRYARYGRHTL